MSGLTTEADHVGLSNVRRLRRELLAGWPVRELQERIVYAVAAAARGWLNQKKSPPDEEIVFPREMVWLSLTSLLESLSESSCWELIDRESVRGEEGPDVVGHIIASNTPLLAMTSVIRALLVCSGSLVKMSSGAHNGWLTQFMEYLRLADPQVASLVEIFYWPRADTLANLRLYQEVDLLVAYGDDATLDSIRKECRRPVLGYGHKISVAIVSAGTREDPEFDGIAKDILMYDQGGCLSPHTVFVEGDSDRATAVAGRLAAALRRCPLPAPRQSSERAARMSEARSLLLMSEECSIVNEELGRWTVLLHKTLALHVSPTHGFIYVVHGTKEGIIQILNQTGGRIQGITLAADDSHKTVWAHQLLTAGIFYVCHPGTLQEPTIHWREDNFDILRSLLVTSKV